MRFSKGIKRLGVFSALSATLVLASACSGISQADMDAAKQQAAAAEQKAAAAQKDSAVKQQEITTLQQKLTAEQKKAEDALKSAGPTGVTPLIYAKAAPTPTPRPAPTPLPAGATPPPPARPTAEFINEVLPFAFYVETLATSSVSTYGFASYPACVPNSIFKRGTKLVWRFEVIDTSTGKRVTDADGATIKIRLPHGEELTPRYSKRGGVGPWTWASGWDIPMSYPLGAFDYTIDIAAKDGRKYTWKIPALVRPATATADGVDSRVQIVP